MTATVVHKKTGKWKMAAHFLAGAVALLGVQASLAAQPEVQFTAEVDKGQISAEESVSLRLRVRADGTVNLGQPSFSAPDFDEINQYSSVFVESYYENGRFGMRNNHNLTRVLRPQKLGDLKITNIKIEANGKTWNAPDIVVKVVAAGAGTPPPKNYGGSGVGLRGAGKRVSHRNVLLRAELDKERAFKGEQIIVSYYLYTRVQLFNIAIEKWPALNGFLKEDLEVPVMSQTQRLDFDAVVLDGVPYKRALLVRYAAYPLQEGKLKIDPVALKFNYYPSQGLGVDDEDDDPFSQFFRQMTPRPGNERSESITVEVTPVPADGKPASFSGGVGDFSMVAAIDKTEAKTNEALTLTVKIEGRGNVASIGEPKAQWPDQLELYDTKGHAKSGRAGVGEKIFEYLLIPRTAGQLTLPSLEFSYFDPTKKAYVTRKTEPVTVNVTQGQAGGVSVPARASTSSGSTPGSTARPELAKQDLRYLKAPQTESASTGPWPIWRWFYWAALASFGVFALLVASDFLKKGRQTAQALMDAKARAHSRSWDKMKQNAQAALRGAPWKDVLETYELLASQLFDAIENIHPIGVRALPRAQLRETLLADKGLSDGLWERIEKTLDYIDTVRFAASAGAVSEDSARQDLARWIDEAQSITKILERIKTQ